MQGWYCINRTGGREEGIFTHRLEVVIPPGCISGGDGATALAIGQVLKVWYALACCGLRKRGRGFGNSCSPPPPPGVATTVLSPNERERTDVCKRQP